MKPAGLRNLLKGGDLRSIGRSDEVAGEIMRRPALFREVFEGIFDEDPVVRARCADAAEKAAAKRPEILAPFRKRLIEEVSRVDQQEVRWHAAQMFGYLDLSRGEIRKVARMLFSWMETPGSSIVRVNSMQTLAGLALKERRLYGKLLPKIEEFQTTGSPSLKSRARKLLKVLKKGCPPGRTRA